LSTNKDPHNMSRKFLAFMAAGQSSKGPTTSSQRLLEASSGVTKSCPDPVHRGLRGRGGSAPGQGPKDNALQRKEGVVLYSERKGGNTTNSFPITTGNIRR